MESARSMNFGQRSNRRWVLNSYAILLFFFFFVGLLSRLWSDTVKSDPILSSVNHNSRDEQHSIVDVEHSLHLQREASSSSGFDVHQTHSTLESNELHNEIDATKNKVEQQPFENLRSTRLREMRDNSGPFEDVGELENPVNPQILYNSDGVAISDQFPSVESWNEQLQADIAYFVQVSQINLPLVARLIERLWHQRNIIVVHIDRKVPDSTVSEFMSRYKDTSTTKYSNLHFLPRQSITYAGVSMLLNTLSAMEFLLNIKQRWDYFINLSGSDYPCISARDLRILLGQPRINQQRVSFLQLGFTGEFEEKVKRFRFAQIHFDPSLVLLPWQSTEAPLIHTYKHNPLADQLSIKFKQHEAWIIAHRSFVVSSVRSAFARRLLVLLAVAKDPEEHFFGMLAWNDPKFNRTTARYAGRGVYWTLNGEKSGQHPYQIDAHQNESGEFSFWKPVKNQPLLFARKFSESDSPLMDLIDKYKSGVHPESDLESVKESLARVRKRFMCHASIDKYWSTTKFLPCNSTGKYFR